jgi:hypothetical protein
MLKFKSSKLNCFALLAATCLVALPAQARDGGNTSGGGDPVEQDFVISGNAAVAALQAQGASFPQINLVAVQQLWDSPNVQVIATDEELFDANGRKKAALNFPALHQIKINRSEWNNIRERKRKMALSLHEIGGLSGFESGNYLVSAKVFGISSAVLEFGSIGAIVNGATFRSVEDQAARPKWIHVETDPEKNRISLGFYDGRSVDTFFISDEYHSDGREDGYYAYKTEDGGARITYIVRPLPDGNFSLEITTFGTHPVRDFFGMEGRCEHSHRKYVRFR